MAPRIKTRPANGNGAGMDELLRRFVALDEQRRAFGSVQGRKLKPEAWVREAIERVGTTPARAEKLLGMLQADTPNLSNARSVFRDYLGVSRSQHYAAPPSLSRLAAVVKRVATDATAELAAHGYTCQEVFAAASLHAANRFPGDFGTQPSSAEVEQQMLDIERERAELESRFASSWSPDELMFTDLNNASGSIKASLKCTGGEVLLAPIETLGQRLVEWSQAKNQKGARA